MKMSHLYVCLLAVFFALPNFAQQKPATQQKTQPPAGNQPRPSFTNASDSLKLAINDFKSSMNHLFGSKKDTVELLISDVEYDDPGVSQLKESLKKLKGAKFLGMQFKSAVVRIDVSYKGKSTELWDGLPEETRRPFKIVEASEKNLLLESRAKTRQ